MRNVAVAEAKIIADIYGSSFGSYYATACVIKCYSPAEGNKTRRLGKAFIEGRQIAVVAFAAARRVL